MDENTKSVFDIDEKAAKYGMSPEQYKKLLLRSCCVPEIPEFPDDSSQENDN